MVSTQRQRALPDGQHCAAGGCTHLIRCNQPREHADESGLARAVLAQHDNDLTVSKAARLHCELEAALWMRG